jgi:bleomycin hydrolase
MTTNMKQQTALTQDSLKAFSDRYHTEPLHQELSNAIQKHGINAAAMNPGRIPEIPYTFSHEITSGPITHQRQSGRFWLLAGLKNSRLNTTYAADQY